MSSRAIAYLIEDIEVLKQRVAPRGDGAIVRMQNGVVEVAKVDTWSLGRHDE